MAYAFPMIVFKLDKIVPECLHDTSLVKMALETINAASCPTELGFVYGDDESNRILQEAVFDWNSRVFASMTRRLIYFMKNRDVSRVDWLCLGSEYIDVDDWTAPILNEYQKMVFGDDAEGVGWSHLAPPPPPPAPASAPPAPTPAPPAHVVTTRDLLKLDGWVEDPKREGVLIPPVSSRPCSVDEETKEKSSEKSLVDNTVKRLGLDKLYDDYPEYQEDEEGWFMESE